MLSSRKLPPVDALAVLLAIAIACLSGVILLSNSFSAPNYVLWLAIIPLAALLLTIKVSNVALGSVVALAAVAYCGSTVLSAVLNDEVSLWHALRQLLPSALIFMFLISFRLISQTRTTFDLLFYASIGLAGFSAAINAFGFVQSGIHPGAIADNRLVPILGTPHYQGSTTVSTTYAVFFVAAFAAIVTRRRPAWQQAALGLAAISLFIALAFTQARSGYIAVLVGLATVSAALTSKGRILTAVFLGSLLLAALYPPFTNALLARGHGYRDDIWLSYLDMASQRPLLGYGALANIHRMVDGFEFFHPHNVFLSAEIRGGVLGVASLLAMFGAALRVGFVHLSRSGDPRILAISLTLVTACLFDYELTITFPDWVWVTFWLPLGFAVYGEAGPLVRGIGSRAVQPSEEQDREVSRSGGGQRTVATRLGSPQMKVPSEPETDATRLTGEDVRCV